MRKYLNKYRQDSDRAPWMDYASVADYFVTINTKRRGHFFGHVKDGEMMLSEIGLIAYHEWERSPLLRPDMNLSLGDFVVMPDHCHAVITIGENVFNSNDDRCGGEVFEIDCPQASMEMNSQFRGLAPQRNNLASIIRGFKSAVTTHSRKMNISDFGWQKLCCDSIIRNQGE